MTNYPTEGLLEGEKLTRHIKVAEEFSDFPIGRYRDDSDACGEAFRDDILAPAIKEAEEAGGVVLVDFSNLNVLSSGFLEESFGGLIRERGKTKSTLMKHLRFSDGGERVFQDYINDAWKYIHRAEQVRIN